MLASKRISGMVIPARKMSLADRFIMNRLAALLLPPTFRHVRINTMTFKNAAVTQMNPMVRATPKVSTPLDEAVIVSTVVRLY